MPFDVDNTPPSPTIHSGVHDIAPRPAPRQQCYPSFSLVRFSLGLLTAHNALLLPCFPFLYGSTHLMSCVSPLFLVRPGQSQINEFILHLELAVSDFHLNCAGGLRSFEREVRRTYMKIELLDAMRALEASKTIQQTVAL